MNNILYYNIVLMLYSSPYGNDIQHLRQGFFFCFCFYYAYIYCIKFCVLYVFNIISQQVLAVFLFVNLK